MRCLHQSEERPNLFLGVRQKVYLLHERPPRGLPQCLQTLTKLKYPYPNRNQTEISLP